MSMAWKSFGDRVWLADEEMHRKLAAQMNSDMSERPHIERVLNNHDATCYTQGMFLVNKTLMYESCGGYGASRLRVLDLETGISIRETKIPKELFAEGIERVGNEILMLTWKEKKLLTFDLETLAPKDEYSFRTTTGQGWGIASNGTTLVVTDGSAWLHFWEPGTLRELYRLPVMDGTRPVRFLNEIEFVSRYEIVANVYFQERLARIDTRTGEVRDWVDLSGVLSTYGDPTGDPEVMNGVAYESGILTDDGHSRLYVTGKRWKSLFQILVPF
ncbi:Glutamine cyclotransferase, putative [Hondaea fermentalgiana]|uniref:Glutamine cyclotransferase, putative n=1 Tax=Hondaea fermentalgiana TaxID=2315210 RepID=A0A2R5G3H0_9STRA|nr:Glutamine cyclotransferase, putative [Hondaea fermentalgiana]|eukprot:GBG24298.1 Glutamine cyclotransferase, putative [Hondaea fermentalgiana]